MYEELNPDISYFVYKDCPKTWSLPQTRLSVHDLTFVLKGKAVYYIDDVPYTLKAGDAVYIPKGSLRRANTFPDDPMRCVAFNFDFTNETVFELENRFSWNQDDTLKLYFKELSHEWMRQKPEFKLKSKALFLLILHRVFTLSETKTASGIQSRRIENYILDHYKEKLCVSKIASALKLSPVYCGALFKKETGITINRYYNQIRVNKAASLLSSGDLSVSQAAYQSGFDDLYYFSKTFKNITGVSPSAYKNLKR